MATTVGASATLGARATLRARVWALLATLCTFAAVIGLSAGDAQAQAAGSTTNASGAIINGGRLAPADCPPGGGTSTSPGGSAGLVTVGAVTANCTSNSATASAANVTIGTLQLGVVQSQCTTGPNGTASSSVAVVNGSGIFPPNTTVISTPTTVNVGLLTVALNEVTTTSTTRTVNAVHVTGAGLDVIVAQSQCSTTAPYPLSAGITKNVVAHPGAADLPVTSHRAPRWLVAAAALALLVAVNVVFLGGAVRRRRADGSSS